MEKEEIEEESSNRVGLLKRCTTGGSTGSTRWVDGSEVDSESSQSWSLFGDEEITKQGYGSVRRRLVKKPKRLDSFDVEAMEISVAHGNHHKKVQITINFVWDYIGYVSSIDLFDWSL